MLQIRCFILQQRIGHFNLLLDHCRFLYLFADMFFGKFNLEGLKFYLLGKVIVLFAVAHVLELLVVLLNLRLAGLNFAFLYFRIFFHLLLFQHEIIDTCTQTGNLIVEVGHLKRKLTTQCFDTVNLRQVRLQFVERLQLVFHGHFLFHDFFSCCHND